MVTSARGEDAPRSLAPGVHIEEAVHERATGFRTGQPAFLGEAQAGQPSMLRWLTAWRQFAGTAGEIADRSALGPTIRGFFDNGGERCLVATYTLDDSGATAAGDRRAGALAACLERLEAIEDVDLMCAPDLPLAGGAMVDLQRLILAHSKQTQNRFVILDARPDATRELVFRQRQDLWPTDGALYYPWIRAPRTESGARWIPPCGHVAGVYARTDARVGVHKAPANALLEGAVDLRVHVTEEELHRLNGAGVNCLRALPGRGIRVWGARTLSGRPEWQYVNVRRLFITLTRWIEHACRDLVFEPSTPLLWNRVQDRLNNYCYVLFQAGALKGLTPTEAFYVKCDAETNPPEQRDRGEVTTEIGLAATRPAEFVVVRISHDATGATIESRPTTGGK
jgi:uncharacterized protein